ncbi:hypothetical protein FNE27_03950 [Helicobacter pylori]|nr:hypothetical protein FNE27_03950 [Helicobacter pylori]
MEKNDRYEIVTNVIESLENGGSFNQRDREKFAQTARTLGIEDSVIKEMIDIYQTLLRRCLSNIFMKLQSFSIRVLISLRGRLMLAMRIWL